MSSKDSSKMDIAKQFELPERKSKIATLLKESDVYCICRSTDSTRFMIACDNCEEWYHGDCIHITEPESRNIKQYFCPPCKKQNPELKIEYKKPKGSPIAAKEKSSKRHERKAGRPPKKTSETQDDDVIPTRRIAGCGSCTGCLTVLDCGRCDRCKKNRKYDGRTRRQCRKRECLDQSDKEEEKPPKETKQETLQQVLTERQIELTDEEDDWQPSPMKSRKQKLTSLPTKKGRKQQRKEAAAKDKSSRRKKAKQRQPSFSGSSGREDSDAVEESRQCYGLDCINAAKKGSKYCSDECGDKLATERLYRILPGRIQEWNLTPCTAEEHNKVDLEEIRRKQLETRTTLTELETKRSELDHHVQFVQQLKVDPDMDDEEQDEDGIIHCITCGHEISIKTCLKHMERCYNKYESQTSFGSIYKTKLEGTPIFCDVFNPVNSTYCKRLKVLCPEHTKEAKIGDSEVCGCPLIKDVFKPSSEICRYLKKKCNKHFCWEKLRRAEIDMERVRNWLKLDELMEQERQLRAAMTNRAGVMGLLLHSTFDHELRSRIVNQMQEESSQKELKDKRRPSQDQKKEIAEAPTSTKKRKTKNVSASYFEPPQDDVVGQPLVKKRDKDRLRPPTGPVEIIKQEKKEEVTASKLYQRMLSNRTSQDSQGSQD